MAMERHSLMAERVAIGRAAHQFLDPGPVIFSDPLARPLIGADGEAWLQENIKWLRQEGMRRTRVLLALRSRFAEEELARAMGEGTRQYVILGAGLDSFAYRRPDLGTTLTVFEADHPATQEWKRKRLAEARIATPRNVRYVALDFNERTLAEALEAAGFRRDEPSFFSWLGVTYYLPRESVMETLRYVGGLAAPRQVVFDYAVDVSALPERYHDIINRVRGYTAGTGEPWVTWFAPAPLMTELRAMGFGATANLEANELLVRFTGDANEDLTPMVALMSVRG